jgi:type IV pilus assembly protein PilB
MPPRKKIGEILIEAGLIDQSGLRSALAEQQRWGGPLGRIMIDLRLVSEVNLVNALSKQLHVPTVDLDKVSPTAEVLALIPAEFAVDNVLLPFKREGKFLDVALSDPANLGIVDELRIRTQLNIRSHLAGPKALERALARFYHRGAGMLAPSMQRDDGQLGAAAPAQEYHVRHTGIELDEAPAGVNPSEVAALQTRITKLEQLISRDEEVLRKLLSLLIEKGVASREEILERLR